MRTNCFVDFRQRGRITRYDVAAIGHGGQFALAAARRVWKAHSRCPQHRGAPLNIAADICIYNQPQPGHRGIENAPRSRV